MIISLEIKDNKAKVFLEFLKDLDFVTIKQSELGPEDNITLLNERLEEYHANPTKVKELKEVLLNLKNKHGF